MGCGCWDIEGSREGDCSPPARMLEKPYVYIVPECVIVEQAHLPTIQGNDTRKKYFARGIGVKRDCMG